MGASLGSSIAILVSGIFFFTLSFKVARKKSVHLVILIIVFCSIISCQHHSVNNVEIDYENQTISVTVEDLKPGATYYWKIVATANSPIKSESIVRTFGT